MKQSLHTDRVTGDDYQNDLDALNTKDEIIAGRNRGNGGENTEDSRQEGSESYQSSDEITEGQSRENIHETIEIQETTENNENGFHATRE